MHKSFKTEKRVKKDSFLALLSKPKIILWAQNMKIKGVRRVVVKKYNTFYYRENVAYK